MQHTWCLFKKGGGRFCVTIDFQMISNNIIINAYPLHRIDDQIDSMRGSAWLKILDLTKGFYQMNLDIGSQNIRHLQHYGTVSMQSLAYGYEDFQCCPS